MTGPIVLVEKKREDFHTKAMGCEDWISPQEATGRGGRLGPCS